MHLWITRNVSLNYLRFLWVAQRARYQYEVTLKSVKYQNVKKELHEINRQRKICLLKPVDDIYGDPLELGSLENVKVIDHFAPWKYLRWRKTPNVIDKGEDTDKVHKR